MLRVPLYTPVVALVVVTVCVPATSAVAQTPANVRVVNGPARIQRWLRPPASVMTDVTVEVEPGTTLEVLGKEKDWYWVIVPRDAHGTSTAGWVRADRVEPVVARAASIPPERDQRNEPVASASPATAGPATANRAEDKVTIAVTRDEAASTRTSPAAATKAYQFEDVHFDRDRHSIRPDEMDILRAAVTALKADPSLVVNIEGYTCSLGTASYNLALGLRRANAVKDYLVKEGVAVDRLHTTSLGKGHAKYDNSREETRRLNRRVALVPNTQP